MFKKLGLAFLSVFIVSTLAYAGGIYTGLPVVGDLAGTTCISFGNNGVCNTFRPIGPANLAGSAIVAADVGGPNQPFTVGIPAALIGASSQDAAPLTATSVTVLPGVAKLILDPAATIAALTVVTPAASTLVDGQELSISSSQTVTTLTVTGGTGTTVAATVTTVTASAAVNLVYHAATSKWVGG